MGVHSHDGAEDMDSDRVPLGSALPLHASVGEETHGGTEEDEAASEEVGNNEYSAMASDAPLVGLRFSLAYPFLLAFSLAAFDQTLDSAANA